MINYGKSVQVIDARDINTLSEELLASDEPILLKGLVRHWPAVSEGLASHKKLSDYIKRFYSGIPVVLYQCDKEKAGRYFYDDDYRSLAFKASRTKLDRVLDELSEATSRVDSDNFYVGSTTVDDCLPGFRQENDIPLGKRDPLVSIWLGNQSRVAAHFDAPDNLACCVAGRRTFTLFPIDQIDNLYVGPIDFTPSGQMISTVDFRNPDLEKHPKFSQAMQHALIADLEPGDALILPSMWWHHVESHTDFNVLVNYWWRAVPSYFDAPLDAIYHSILALRDLPEREKQAWRVVFNHFIFDDQGGKYDHIPEGGRGILNHLDDESARKIRMVLLNKLNR